MKLQSILGFTKSMYAAAIYGLSAVAMAQTSPIQTTGVTGAPTVGGIATNASNQVIDFIKAAPPFIYATAGAFAFFAFLAWRAHDKESNRNSMKTVWVLLGCCAGLLALPMVMNSVAISMFGNSVQVIAPATSHMAVPTN